MKPICVSCRRFFRIKKTGVAFIEGMPKTRDAKPGLQEPENWAPYKLWHGDLWECEGCGTETIAGVGREPIAEHYQADFSADVTAWNAEITINDC